MAKRRCALERRSDLGVAILAKRPEVILQLHEFDARSASNATRASGSARPCRAIPSPSCSCPRCSVARGALPPAVPITPEPLGQLLGLHLIQPRAAAQCARHEPCLTLLDRSEQCSDADTA